MKKILETGFLINNGEESKKEVFYEMVFLDKQHIDEILALQEKVFSSLDNPEIFIPDTREFIENEILPPEKGFIIGVLVENQLIAQRTVSFPKLGKHNLGREIGIPKDELSKVAHLESTIVDPVYRGNRLQYKMLHPTLQIIKEEGYHYVLATISPYNYPSLKNIMDHGFKIKDLKKRDGDYGGKLRFTMMLDLRKKEKNYQLLEIAMNTEIEKQRQLIAEGLEGYRLEKQKENFKIYYGKSFSY